MSAPTDLIPGTSFTNTEDEELIRLLGKVKQDGCRWPTERSTRAAHGVVSYWAPELVITRLSRGRTEILLAVYEGGIEEFKGMWHIPGGYNLWIDLDVQGVCSRVARREIGVDVVYLGVIHEHKWRPGEHPYGTPLSLFVECEPFGKIPRKRRIKFFPVEGLPERMVPAHPEFIRTFLVR